MKRKKTGKYFATGHVLGKLALIFLSFKGVICPFVINIWIDPIEVHLFLLIGK